MELSNGEGISGRIHQSGETYKLNWKVSDVRFLGKATTKHLVRYASSFFDEKGQVPVKVGHVTSAGETTEISSYHFQYATGAKLNYIPFGVAKSVAALLGGHGDVPFQRDSSYAYLG